MEYKNRCSSPLDMADGEILNDILGDSCTGYGESRRAANSDTGCSCNTGCSRNEQRRVTPQRDNRRSTRGERSGCSCGQSRERDETTREESGCGRGCMTDRRLESFPLAMVYSPEPGVERAVFGGRSARTRNDVQGAGASLLSRLPLMQVT